MSKPPSKSTSSGKATPPEVSSPPTLQDEIERQIGDLVPQSARAQVVARVTTIMMSEHFSGPIAHPRHLREYEDICPGSADRIISMAEERNRHNISMENKALSGEIEDQKRGMQYGAGLFCLLIISALAAAVLDLGAIIVGLFLSTAAIGAIGAFIKGRNGKP